jgi:hypothetical protein
MKRTSLISIIVLALVVIAIVFYLARPHADETDIAQRHESPAPTQATIEPSSPPSTLVSCTGPSNSQVSLSNLVARHQWAHSLALANHFDSALTELRNIATLDPGYPAINLDISDALLKSKHASEAKDAINLQLEISECLANLPQQEMQDYCGAEWASEPRGGCAVELARINQQAHYEAGRVDAELSRNSQPHPAPEPSATTVAQQRARFTPSRGISPAVGSASAAQLTASANPPAASVVAAVPVPAVTPAPLPPINIKAAEAADHIGQLAKVCGVIASKHTAEESNGKPTFVNLEHSFPNPAFTVLIWGTDATAVGDIPESGSLCVTGTVVSYRGTPEIVLHEAKNWSQSSPQ